MKLFRIFKEINNYYFIKKVIKKNKNTDEWKKHKLQIGYFGVMYSVINLPPEVYESEAQYYQLYVLDQLKPVNEYLASLNLQEIITLRVENISDKPKGIYAFGIKYVPLFKDFTLTWITKWVFLIGIISFFSYYFDLINKANDLFNWGITYIKSFKK